VKGRRTIICVLIAARPEGGQVASGAISLAFGAKRRYPINFRM
jgi:hypothetical protein